MIIRFTTELTITLKVSIKAPLYNEIHNLVSRALRNKYSRALGFFLKSDRYYPSQGFNRSRLFDYGQITQRDYIWSMAFSTSDNQYKDMFESFGSTAVSLLSASRCLPPQRFGTNVLHKILTTNL